MNSRIGALYPWGRFRFASLVVLLCLMPARPLVADAVAPTVQSITIEREDGVRLYGSLFLPQTEPSGTLLPAVVQVNPWALPDSVYRVQARRLASLGFVVLTYTARGFGASGGTIGGGGPGDVKDAMAVIDWLIGHAPVDAERIGMMGMSLGAGITLLTAAHDPRVKVVATLSGWADFYRAMSEQGTVPDVWEHILIWAGKTLGHMDDEMRTFMERVRAYDISEDEMRAYAQPRSPIHFVDVFNRRGVAVYIQHNFQDYMFPTNQIVDFFNQLTCEKKLDLNFGVHLTPELFEVANPASPLWGRAIDWMYDRLIAGPTAAAARSEPYVVAAGVKFRQQKMRFSSWPPPVERRSFDLSFEPGAPSGRMEVSQDGPTRMAQKTISSKAYSGINTGIPILSAALEAHFKVPVFNLTQAMARQGAMIFDSANIDAQSLLFGAAHVDCWIIPSAPRIQLVGYLFSVNRLGLATLITHAPLTFLDGRQGEPRKISWNLIFTAHELAVGERLLFAVDTYDPYYARPSKDAYTVTFLFGEDYPAHLSVPFLHEAVDL